MSPQSLSASARPNRRQRLVGFLGVVFLVFAAVGTVFANAADPSGITSVSGGIDQGQNLTVSGTWSWESQDYPCIGNNATRWVGWAMQWDDGYTQNFVQSKGEAPGVGFYVGSPVVTETNYDPANNDGNKVSTNRDCGDHSASVGANPITPVGTFGPMTHTFKTPLPQSGTRTVCLILYDIHTAATGGSQLNGAIVAGDTNLAVDSSAGFTVGDEASVENEVVIVTAIPDATHITVTRAFGGTSAVAHADNKKIQVVVNQGGDDLAGGPGHNKDNSAETNSVVPTAVTSAQCVQIFGPLTPTITTVATDSTLPAAIHDTATLGGGSNPQGTMTFSAYGPTDPNCQGTAAFGPVSVPVDGAGTYGSGDFTPASAGTYSWLVSYTSSNTGANASVSKPCGDQSQGSDETSTVTAAPTSNLAYEKTVSTSANGTFIHTNSANPGDTLFYKIVATNSGNANATQDVTDVLSSALVAHSSAFDTATCLPACTYDAPSRTITWSGVTVNAGTSATLTFSVELNGTFPSGTTTLDNAVVSSGGNCAANSTDPTCGTTTSVSAAPILAYTKTVSTSANGTYTHSNGANPGDTLFYKIVAANSGNANATVVVTDVLSAALAANSGAFDTATCLPACSYDAPSRTITWSGVTVNAGSSATLTFSDALNSIFPNGSTTLDNTVVSTDGNCLGNSVDTNCATTTTVNAAPVIVVAKTVDQSIHQPGDALTYTITFRNTGNADATNVTGSDDLTESLAHGSLTSCSPDCTVTNGVASFSIPTVAAGQTVTITVVVQLDSAGWPTTSTTTIHNTVVATNSNCASLSTDPSCSPTTQVPPPGLAIAKTVCADVNGAPANPCTSDSLNATAGDTIWWQIRVQNTGQATLTNVTIGDDHAMPQSGTTNCPIPPTTLTSGQVYTCSYAQTAPLGSTVNTATASSTQAGPVQDAASVTAGAVPAPAIGLDKTASPTSLPAGGGHVTYSYVVTNPGNVALTNVSVSDDKCSPVTYVSGDTNTNSILETTETWHFTCSATISVTTTNTAIASGTYQTVVTATDQATVTVATAGPNPPPDPTATPTPTPHADACDVTVGRPNRNCHGNADCHPDGNANCNPDPQANP